MKLLPELKYVESHEWVRVEENKAYVGITDYAQEQLGILFMWKCLRLEL